MSADTEPTAGAGPEMMAGAGTLSVRDALAATPPDGAPDKTRSRTRSRRGRERWAARATVAAAALGGAVTEVAPSGSPVADRVTAAAFVALLAAAGGSAKRWTWFVAAGAGLTLSEGRVALVCGVAAVALAYLSTGPIRPAPAVGAGVGGLAGLALLRAADVGFHGSSALLVALAVMPLLVSGYRYSSHRTQRRVRRAIAVVAVLLVVVGAAYVLAAANARPAAERGIDLLEQGIAAAREGDDEVAIQRLDAAADAFADADRYLGSWYAAPTEVVPVVGHNARAASTMASSAAAVSRGGTAAGYDADLTSLRVEDGRLDLERVRGLSEPLGDVADVLDTAGGDLAALDEGWLLTPVADQLDRVQAELAAARPDVEIAADATEAIPAMFGGDGESRWLVAFVTPVEARGNTGFAGNFAELTAVDGEIEMTRFGRAGELESGGTPGPERTLSGPEDYLQRWARFDPAQTWRNVTMSPHYPSVGQVMTELYPQAGGRPIDGVIAIDPVGLAALLTFSGPISVPDLDEPLTSETAADYLLREQYLTDDQVGRIDTLEDVSRATFERLTTGDLPAPRTIADVLGPVVEGGHIHAYGVEPDHQALFEQIGLDGAMPPVVGDSLGIVTNNAVGNKIDLFLQRQIDYDASWDPATGAVEATATVTLTNSAPSEGLPDYIIGSSITRESRPPPGTNRTYLSVYTPWELEEALLDGTPVEIERQVEQGRYAYSLFVDIPPEEATRTITLELAGLLHHEGEYVLDVSKQPLVEPDQLRLTVDVAGDGALTADEPLVLDGRRVGVAEPLVDEVSSYRIATDP